MRLLLDTHFAVWLATQRDRLKEAELALLIDPDNELWVSSVSIWEIRLKWNSYFKSGSQKGPVDPTQLLALIEKLEIELLPLLPSQAATALSSPAAHKDPFDELLLVHAQELGLKLLTRDRKLQDHPQVLSAPSTHPRLA
jgi:PIN domain nuclease of toxin-antitoxin system